MYDRAGVYAGTWHRRQSSGATILIIIQIRYIFLLFPKHRSRPAGWKGAADEAGHPQRESHLTTFFRSSCCVVDDRSKVWCSNGLHWLPLGDNVKFRWETALLQTRWGELDTAASLPPNLSDETDPRTSRSSPDPFSWLHMSSANLDHFCTLFILPRCLQRRLLQSGQRTREAERNEVALIVKVIIVNLISGSRATRWRSQTRRPLELYFIIDATTNVFTLRLSALLSRHIPLFDSSLPKTNNPPTAPGL